MTALRSMGIFGFDHARTHIHVDRALSRARSPHDRRRRLNATNRDGTQIHWDDLVEPEAGDECRVGVVDALRQALRCDHPHRAIASVENALHLGAIREDDLAVIFGRLPSALRRLRHRLNADSESGVETVLRLALEDAGIRSEIQVTIPGVGRVDGVVEGRLIWEADSRLAHDGWELHVRDRDRDLDAARQGYMTLRPAYRRAMFATADVVEAVRSLLDATRR